MFQKLIATTNDKTALLTRLALGAVMFPHGAQKALGWFGGYGFRGTLGFFTGTLHIPAPLAVLAIAAEFLGAIGLVVGLFGRVAAFGIGMVMAVAITMHGANGFFMNWTGGQAGEGFEYHLLALALVAAVIVKGSGAYSLDGWLASKVRSTRTAVAATV